MEQSEFPFLFSRGLFRCGCLMDLSNPACSHIPLLRADGWGREHVPPAVCACWRCGLSLTKVWEWESPWHLLKAQPGKRAYGAYRCSGRCDLLLHPAFKTAGAGATLPILPMRTQARAIRWHRKDLKPPPSPSHVPGGRRAGQGGGGTASGGRDPAGVSLGGKEKRPQRSCCHRAGWH